MEAELSAGFGYMSIRRRLDQDLVRRIEARIFASAASAESTSPVGLETSPEEALDDPAIVIQGPTNSEDSETFEEYFR